MINYRYEEDLLLIKNHLNQKTLFMIVKNTGKDMLGRLAKDTKKICSSLNMI